MKSKKKINTSKKLCDMTDKEFKTYLSDMKKFAKKLSKSPKLSKDFLVLAGIITKKGNFRKPYRNLPYVLPSVYKQIE